jgi:AcrR family transcriptional regulator
MPQRHPTLKPSVKRQTQILETATVVFAEFGYRRTRVQDIADRALVGKGTVYRIFPTKEALFLATVRYAVESLMEAVDRETEGIEDPIEQLKAAIKAYLRFFDAKPDIVELFLQERVEFRDLAKPTYFLYKDTRSQRWLSLIETLLKQGKLRPFSPEIILETLSELLYGAIVIRHITASQVSLESRLEDQLSIVLNGILSKTPV